MRYGAGLLLAASLLFAAPAHAQSAFPTPVEVSIAQVLPRMISWRRDFHQNPELSYEEVRTARIVAQHLRSLRLDEVRTGVALTGVVGVLRGGRPGPVIALRADMDALPVTEEVDLPFASRARGTYNGQAVGIMHACGHDTHVAVLMAAASVLAARRAEIAGTIIFVFQPSEEGAPPGGLGGARRMLAENVFGDLRPEAIFGLHAWPRPTGTVTIVPGPFMAGADQLSIIVHGRQTHGAQPHRGIDPIVVSAQIVNALQTIPSRQMDAVRSPVIVTIGSIHGGVRYNIIPDRVECRAPSATSTRKRARISMPASAAPIEQIAAERRRDRRGDDPEQRHSGGQSAGTNRARAAALARALGEEHVLTDQPNMVAEDFAFFQQAVPGVFFYYGVNPPACRGRRRAQPFSAVFRARTGDGNRAAGDACGCARPGRVGRPTLDLSGPLGALCGPD